jgi:NAD+ diphosphatase
MIQDIFPHRFNNQYLANQSIYEDDYILHYQENTLLLKTQGAELAFPQKKDFPEISAATEAVFLFSLNEVPCFLVWDDLKVDESQFEYKDISFFRTTTQREIGWVSIVGLHLRNWYNQNKFCGKCGSKTQHKNDERAMVCPSCNTVVYPKISPAIIVAIISNDKILLAHNANFAGNWYSLIAGYVDVGETLEETLVREVKEEVGLDVWNIRYYKSQPWALSGSMMIGFIAEADENQAICIDGKEITDAAWFSRGNLPGHPSTISIAGEIIEKFERGELY